MSKKPDITLWTFKFVIRADTLKVALRKLKDTVGVEASSNNADREISGLYIIQQMVSDDMLTKEFYDKISSSSDIAIHSDEKSTSLYPKIIRETQQVEERLRWLLLHVSDAVEDYAEHVRAKKGAIIHNQSLDPATSILSFETMIAILEIDLSWLNQGVTTDKVNQAIAGAVDYESLKSKLLEETAQQLIWDRISKLVLEKPVKWTTLRPKLMRVKRLRNDAAHFNTVTDDSLIQAQNLSSQIMRNLTKKKTYTLADVKAFAGLNRQVSEAMKSISRIHLENMQPAIESMLGLQRSIVQSSGLAKSIGEVSRLTGLVPKELLDGTLSKNIGLQASMLSKNLPKITMSNLGIAPSTLASIAELQKTLDGLNLSDITPSNTEDDSADSDNNNHDGNVGEKLKEEKEDETDE